MKLEISTKNIPSVLMDDIIQDIKKEYVWADKISLYNFNELLKIVPEQVIDKDNYLLIFCKWFVDGIAIPIIKETIEKLLKSGISNININDYQRFKNFKKFIEKGVKNG